MAVNDQSDTPLYVLARLIRHHFRRRRNGALCLEVTDDRQLTIIWPSGS